MVVGPHHALEPFIVAKNARADLARRFDQMLDAAHFFEGHAVSLRLRCVGRRVGEAAGFSTPQLVLRARSDLFAVAKFAMASM